jgi:nitrogen regulatory protein PII
MQGRARHDLKEGAMKMFLIVYCDAADEDVIDTFKKCGVRAYTKMSEARGEGTDTVPKLGTHCWPGKNNALFIAASDDEVSRIKEAIHEIRREHPRSGVKGFILPMEESV